MPNTQKKNRKTWAESQGLPGCPVTSCGSENICAVCLAGPNRLVSKVYCCYCDKRIQYAQDWTKEHLVPKSASGRSNGENLRDCCSQCNQDRANKPLPVWITEMQNAITRSDNHFLIAYLYKRIENARKWQRYIEKIGAQLYKYGRMPAPAPSGDK